MNEVSLGIRRECLDCGTIGRTKSQQDIVNCPNCDGLYVDSQWKNKIQSVIKKSNYIKKGDGAKMVEPTVTMSLREYDALQNKINVLKNESIRRYIRKDFIDIKENKYNITINVDGIIDFAKANHEECDKIYLHRIHSFDHRLNETEVYTKETDK